MALWKQWESLGTDWQTIFEVIDPPHGFAKRYSMQIALWRWDEPSRVLNWTEAGYNRNIRLLIEGEPGNYTIKVSGAAWRDVQEGDQRYRHVKSQQKFGQVKIEDVKLATDARRPMLELLEKARAKVDSWEELPEKVDLGKVF